MSILITSIVKFQNLRFGEGTVVNTYLIYDPVEKFTIPLFSVANKRGQLLMEGSPRIADRGWFSW